MKKFNATWKNKGSTDVNSPKLNATMMQQITDNIDELIEEISKKAKKQSIKNCNFDSLPTYGTGLFIGESICTNSPIFSGVANWHWYIIQIVYDPTKYAMQIAVPLHTHNRVWVRTCINQTWQSWQSLNNDVVTGSIALKGTSNAEIFASKVKQIGKIVHIHVELKLLVDFAANGGLMLEISGVDKADNIFATGYYGTTRWNYSHALGAYLSGGGEFHIYNNGEVCKAGGYIKFNISYIVD